MLQPLHTGLSCCGKEAMQELCKVASLQALLTSSVLFQCEQAEARSVKSLVGTGIQTSCLWLVQESGPSPLSLGKSLLLRPKLAAALQLLKSGTTPVPLLYG